MKTKSSTKEITMNATTLVTLLSHITPPQKEPIFTKTLNKILKTLYIVFERSV